MGSISVTPLEHDRPWGARILGVNDDALRNEDVRQQLRGLFEAHGLLLFEDMEPSLGLHVNLSEVFGSLKPHPTPTPDRIDPRYPGILNISHDPDKAHGVVELDGRRLAHWLPWHFDHCYNNELNRGGILRPIRIAPDGGMTGFCDGIEMYNALPSDLRAKVEQVNVLYAMVLDYRQMRFGKVKNLKVVQDHPTAAAVTEQAKRFPRAIHPAVWTRRTGEKVLHVSPWMSLGIKGRETPDGDSLLDEVCDFINAHAKTHAYFHTWRPTDMVLWDNWRILHSVSGHDPKFVRHQARTTIKGDYGLGTFENNGVGGKVLETTY